MQKSGKTSKIDFYKFISPKGIKAGDDSEGTAAANVIAVKTVKANNQIGKTLNGIGAVLQDIHKKMAVNAMMEADYHKELKKSIADDSKPKNSDSLLFNFGPIWIMVVSLASFALLPFYFNNQMINTDLSLMLFIAISSFFELYKNGLIIFSPLYSLTFLLKETSPFKPDPLRNLIKKFSIRSSL